MLQQTQACRVVSFFENWMKLFPSVKLLAQASEEMVIKAWEGLGYYSRARSLHRAAKIIVDEFGGQIPSEKELLSSIPGIGPYTTGAILSFAFHKKAAAIDANVRRVMSRFLNLPKVVEEVVEPLLSEDQPWHTMEALIELGALVCRKTPQCAECPLCSQCLAHKKGVYDVATTRPLSRTTRLWRDVAVIVCKGHVFVLQNDKGIMKGLSEFLYFEGNEVRKTLAEFSEYLSGFCKNNISALTALPSVSHAFTRFRCTLHPNIVIAEKFFEYPVGKWVKIQDVSLLPFSSGHKRVLVSALSFLNLSATLAYL
jgi:A/G-specific adenine glycosylase